MRTLAAHFWILQLVPLLASAAPFAKNGGSIGQPLPRPMHYESTPNVYFIDVANFQFQLASTSYNCDILQSAMTRYYPRIFRPAATMDYVNNSKANLIASVLIDLQAPCQTHPSLDSVEDYMLSTVQADRQNPFILSTSVWGILRGIDTFSQLIFYTSDGRLALNETLINDSPRFRHRGLLLDTSRHYLPVSALKQNLDAMELNKFNVFHWHIVDDQSFPYESVQYPDLSAKGAFTPRHVYSRQDITEIIEYARYRGIRVVAEFDTPGHSRSWGQAYPDLLTSCCDKSGVPTGSKGPIDPSKSGSYDFLKSFFAEVFNTFPDNYVHLGGDEVPFDCWKSNPNITKFMQQMGFGTDYAQLESYYISTLLSVLNSISPQNSHIVWQEVFDNGVKLLSETVVHIWLDGYAAELAKVTAANQRALLSSCWYLNEIHYGQDWQSYYTCDPHNFTGTLLQKSLVIGGEVCMWGEWVDATNVLARTWPRASAVAERLWSPQNVTDQNDAAARLTEHRCRLIRRGIPAEPLIGPGYCTYEWGANDRR